MKGDRVCGFGSCAAPLVRRGPGPFPTYCSGTCKAKAWRERNPERAAAQIALRAAKLASERRARQPDVECPYCGEVRMRPHWASCTERGCRKAHLARRQREFQTRYRDENGIRYHAERYGEKRRGYVHKRKARQRSAVYEEFDRREVFDRDGWVCGICFEPVDPGLRYPGGMSVSLDHRTPVSRGGEHTRENTRCSHLICNVRRGDRAGEI